MKYLAGLLSLCFLLSGLHGEDVREQRSVSESYSDPETGIVFPAKIGSFRKTEVSRSFNALIGTTVRYSGENGECADIYLYTLSSDDRYLTQDDMVRHYRSSVNSILKLPAGTALITSVRLEKDQMLPGYPFPVWEAYFRLTFAGNEVRNTCLVLLPIRRHAVKLRFTPASDRPEELLLFRSFEAEFFILCKKAVSAE